MKLLLLISLLSAVAYGAPSPATTEIQGIRNCDIYLNRDFTPGFRDVAEVLLKKGFVIVTERTFPYFWETDFLFSHTIHFRNVYSDTPDFIDVRLNKVIHRPGHNPEFDGYDDVASFTDVPNRIGSNKAKILRAAKKFPRCVLPTAGGER